MASRRRRKSANRCRCCGDGQLDRYIDSVGARLAANAPGPKYPYSFGVVNYKELNAFALPGGPIYVHRGTIAAARTESQLAGVMAHEVAHIAQRHAAKQISKGIVANGLLGLLGAVLDDGGKGEAAARIGASVLAQSVFMKFSRDDEREADRVGAQIMERAGWDPHGLAEFMQVLQQQQQRSPSSVETFFSSHPSPAGRVRDLQGDGRRQVGPPRLGRVPGDQEPPEFAAGGADDAEDQLVPIPPLPPSPKEGGLSFGGLGSPLSPAWQAHLAARPASGRSHSDPHLEHLDARQKLIEYWPNSVCFCAYMTSSVTPPPLKFPRRREPTPRLAWMPGFAS